MASHSLLGITAITPNGSAFWCITFHSRCIWKVWYIITPVMHKKAWQRISAYYTACPKLKIKRPLSLRLHWLAQVRQALQLINDVLCNWSASVEMRCCTKLMKSRSWSWPYTDMSWDDLTWPYVAWHECPPRFCFWRDLALLLCFSPIQICVSHYESIPCPVLAFCCGSKKRPGFILMCFIIRDFVFFGSLLFFSSLLKWN